MEETDELIAPVPVPRRARFLLYTNDGQDIMWGVFANGYFRGEDNHGKYAWGIYGKSVFAGFYDGEFFWGRYRRGNWKAFGLFDKNYSKGKYVIFPPAIPRVAALK